MAVIGIMDSGVGGLSVFREISRVLPGEHYIYYADNVEKGKATIILSAKPDVEGQPYIGACSGTFTISNQVIGK